MCSKDPNEVAANIGEKNVQQFVDINGATTRPLIVRFDVFGAPGLSQYFYLCKSFDYAGEITHIMIMGDYHGNSLRPLALSENGDETKPLCVLTTSHQVLFKLVQSARVLLKRTIIAVALKMFDYEADEAQPRCSHVILAERSATLVPLDHAVTKKKAPKKYVAIDLGFGIELTNEDLQGLKKSKAKRLERGRDNDAESDEEEDEEAPSSEAHSEEDSDEDESDGPDCR